MCNWIVWLCGSIVWSCATVIWPNLQPWGTIVWLCWTIVQPCVAVTWLSGKLCSHVEPLIGDDLSHCIFCWCDGLGWTHTNGVSFQINSGWMHMFSAGLSVWCFRFVNVYLYRCRYWCERSILPVTTITFRKMMYYWKHSLPSHSYLLPILTVQPVGLVVGIQYRVTLY